MMVLLIIKSLSRSYNFYVHNYFAIDEHWSWGISTNLNKSTYTILILAEEFLLKLNITFIHIQFQMKDS